MVEDDAREGVIDAVVDVVAAFAVADRLADHLDHDRAGRGHQEPPGLGQDLHVRREKPLQFALSVWASSLKGRTLLS